MICKLVYVLACGFNLTFYLLVDWGIPKAMKWIPLCVLWCMSVILWSSYISYFWPFFYNAVILDWRKEPRWPWKEALCFSIRVSEPAAIQTSTTPSCGGPLRAQIFHKVCFYKKKNMTFGPLVHVLTILNRPPNSYFFIFFSNIRFLSLIVTLSPLAKMRYLWWKLWLLKR